MPLVRSIGPPAEGEVEQSNGQEILTVEGTSIRSMLLIAQINSNVIRRLVYTNAGDGILALSEDGKHLLWTWSTHDDSLAARQLSPKLSQSTDGQLMTIREDIVDIVRPCFSLSRNDYFLISACRKNIVLYRMLLLQKIKDIRSLPHDATCIMFYPPNNSIIFVGMVDSSILIFNIPDNKVIRVLQGHSPSKRICGLAFSTALNVLISSAVDTEIVLWDSNWEKKKSVKLEMAIVWLTWHLSETNIELDKEEKQLLVVHATQLAIYEITTLERLKRWASADFFSPRISHAAFSCDSQMVYAVMKDGILIILGASRLTPIAKINPSTYLASHPSVYQVVVAAHPRKPNEIALGLSNGGIVVVEILMQG